MESPKTGRATISEGFNSLQITIPAKKNYLMIVMPVISIGMFFVIVPADFFKNMQHDSFFVFFGILWLVVGLSTVLRTVFWTLAGKEVIKAEDGTITIQRKGDLLSRTRSYNLSEACNFRAEENNSAENNNVLNNFTSDFKGIGTICFEYGVKTIRFGEGLSQAEGNYIIQKLKDKNLVG